MLRQPAFLLALAALTLPAFAQQRALIRITADLTDAPRKLYHAEVDIPVKPGVVTLTTPKWIPGNHRPTGPVSDITGIVFTANGKTLAWRRDEVDLYAFHVTVPAGVSTLHAHLDCIVTERVTPHMAVLEWERLLLYPNGEPVRNIPVQPTVVVPTGWGIGTALTPTGAAQPGGAKGTTTQYAATTVEQLEDSPVIAGQYFHEFPLATDVQPQHFLDVVSDRPEDSNLRPQFVAEISTLVHEAFAMYGSHHYNQYHFLLTLSDAAGSEGLEHGQSSDNGVGERAYSSQERQLPESDLLAHEFTHSWNGKYRRPAGLYQPDFYQPEHTDLLWVYEGMTQYLGNVLAARSGLKSQEQYRDVLALVAATLDDKPGRDWRSTEDTAIAAPVLRALSTEWSNWRRGQDYYQEGELLWLDVDTTIRQLTQDKKNLHDFILLFLAKGGDTGPQIVTYDLNEIVADLNQVAPHDWAAFFKQHVTDITLHTDLGAIEQAGYRLVYTDKLSDGERLYNADLQRGPDVWFSLGLRVDGRGTIQDIRWNSPADKAGIAPGSRLLAANGIAISTESLHDAIVAAKGSTQAVQLLIQSEDRIRTIDIDYHDGERYPHLERIQGTPDYLGEITTPLTKPVQPAATTAH